MRYSLIANCVIASLLMSSVVNAETLREKVNKCVSDRIELLRTQSLIPYAISNKIICTGGQFKNLSCERDRKEHTLTYRPDDGRVIVSATLAELSNVDGSHGPLTWTPQVASVSMKCEGHGCDRADNKWIDLQISGQTQAVLTAPDFKSAMDACLETQ